MRWKLIGLAGVAGVTASGAVVVRRRRGQQELEPDELRERLHERLAATREAAAPSPGGPATAAHSARPRGGAGQAAGEPHSAPTARSAPDAPPVEP